MPSISTSARLAGLLKNLRQFRYDVARLREQRRVRAVGGRLILLGTHDLSVSGAPRLVLEMAQILQNGGYECQVTSLRDGPMRKEFSEVGVPVFIETLAASRSSQLASEAADAVCTIVNSVAAAPLAQGWGLNAPTLWYLHEVSLLHEMSRQAAIASALRSVDAVWAGSRLCADQIRAIRPDISVVPYGVPALDGNPVSASASRPLRIGVFGSIEWRKGQDIALDAFELLDPTVAGGLELHLFGRVLDETVAMQVETVARRNPVVRYGGELSPESYRQHILAMDAVLIPSREDTLPLVSLDALSAGKIVMTTRCVGTSDFLHDDFDALIEEKANIPAVKRLFERLHRRRERLADIGAVARSTFFRHFSREAFAERMLAQVHGMERFP